MMVSPTATPTVWGPFILYPAGTDPDSVGGERGVTAYPDLAGADLDDDARVMRVARPEELNDELKAALRLPSLPGDYELSGVRVLPSPDGRLFRSVAFWHRGSTVTRTPETADVFIARSMAAPPPNVIIRAGALPADSPVSAWSIEPVMVGGHQGIFQRFANNPSASRESQNANSLEWFDDEGYKMILRGWDLSLDELLKLAETLTAPRP